MIALAFVRRESLMLVVEKPVKFKCRRLSCGDKSECAVAGVACNALLHKALAEMASVRLGGLQVSRGQLGG